MGAIWLGSLPQVLRDAGLAVDTYPGWETRSRSTGGYDALLGIQIHHTASNASPLNDMAFMWINSPTRPIGALYLARDGRWTVGAAGATNTSGQGGPLATSRGTIPKDAANRYVISIEAANRGDGEIWPDVQLDSYVRGVAALSKAYFGGKIVTIGDVHAHHEWAPTRKIDPAGQSWYASGRNKWNMTSFRNDVATALSPPPPPPTTTYERIAMAENFEFANAQRWDTRGFGNPLPAGEYVCKLDGSAGKVGALVNMTVVSGGAAGFASAWASGPRPDKSKLNYGPSGAVANEFGVALAADGSFRIYISAPAHIIVDLTGYWL